MAAFCPRQHCPGRRSAAELTARLRAAAPGTLDEALTAALRDAVLALVTVLKALNAAIKDASRSVPGRLAEHPDGRIFTSLPRPGQVSAASMLAEWGDCRDACNGPDSVAALAGICPVTKASGKHHVAGFRWACKQALPQGHDHFRRQQPARQRAGCPALRRCRWYRYPARRHAHEGQETVQSSATRWHIPHLMSGNAGSCALALKKSLIRWRPLSPSSIR
jgi:transposase